MVMGTRGPGRARRLVVLAGASLVLVGGAPAAAAATPHCASSQLRLKFVSFQGATGHRYWQLAVKNLASKCSLRGFPRVRLLDAHGHWMHVRIKHETGPVPTVIVGHDKRAHFTFSYADGAFCSKHFHAYRIKVFPPKDAGGLIFNPVPKNFGPIFVCTGSARVSPVRAHPDG